MGTADVIEGSFQLFGNHPSSVFGAAGGGGISARLMRSSTAVIHSTFSGETARLATGGSLSIDEPLPFYAASVSVVIHAHNPMVPSVHANYRYFEAGHEDAP